MPSFFSYSTLASLSFASGCVSGTGASIMFSSIGGRSGAQCPLDEGAQAGDGFAEDEILDLIRSFVGIKRLGVREKARCLVVCDDAVAAQQLAGPCNGLATLSCGKCFGERGMGIRQLAFGV